MLKKILAIGLILALIVGGVVFYLLNKPHRTAEDEKPVAVLTADELFNQFNNEPDSSNTKYLEKVIQVTGTVNSIKTVENNGKTENKIALATPDEMGIAEISVILKEGEKTEGIQEGTTIVLKGICNGFNTDVELRQAVIVK